MNEWRRFRDKVLADSPETREEYERLAPHYRLISDLVRLRRERGLTQEELAQRMGTHQPAVARFESGRTMPSFRFLMALAEALDADLTVHLEPRESIRAGTASTPH